MHHQIYCIYTLLEFQQDLDAPSDLLYLHTARVSRGTKCTIRFTVFTHYLSFNRNIMHYQIYYIYTYWSFNRNVMHYQIYCIYTLLEFQ